MVWQTLLIQMAGCDEHGRSVEHPISENVLFVLHFLTIIYSDRQTTLTLCTSYMVHQIATLPCHF